MTTVVVYLYVSPPCCGTLSLRLWWLTMVFCETSVTRDTTNELWWRFYANSSERELLLRNVFQDWIVDDGNNYYTTCGNPHMAIMTPSDESLSKPFGRVFSPINSAGQWVFLLMRRKSSWALKINLFRSTFEKWCHELWNQTSPHLFPFIGLKISFCHFDAIAATLINPLQTQALLGPNPPSNQ